MNPLRPIFAIDGWPVRTLALSAGGLLLAGCVGSPFAEARIDPTSPVAGDVARMTRQGTDYPSFSEIPAAPKDLRPPALYGRQAAELKQAGDQLVAATAPSTWTLKATDTFAAEARRRTPELPPPDPAAAEAFARELRERAKPPPPR